jgi:hypothetical protein
MKNLLWIGLGIMVVIALVVAGLAAGWALWGRKLWAAGPSATPGIAMGGRLPQGCGGWGYGMGRGMMDRGAAPAGPCPGLGYGVGPGVPEGGTDGSSGALTIDEAHEAVERYIASLCMVPPVRSGTTPGTAISSR